MSYQHSASQYGLLSCSWLELLMYVRHRWNLALVVPPFYAELLYETSHDIIAVLSFDAVLHLSGYAGCPGWSEFEIRQTSMSPNA